MTAPSYTDWHVGMKVVCVDASPSQVPHQLEERKIYVLQQIQHSAFVDCRLGRSGVIDAVGVKVAGAGLRDRDWFGANRFRPVQTRQTDISIFQAMLSPKPAKVKKVRA